MNLAVDGGEFSIFGRISGVGLGELEGRMNLSVGNGESTISGRESGLGVGDLDNENSEAGGERHGT